MIYRGYRRLEIGNLAMQLIVCALGEAEGQSASPCEIRLFTIGNQKSVSVVRIPLRRMVLGLSIAIFSGLLYPLQMSFDDMVRILVLLQK